SSLYMDYPLKANFKSASPSIKQTISKINCDGWTSSAMGLWNAYTALVSLNAPGALNVIVFFTDGQPTALTASVPIILPSTGCNPVLAPKTGVLTPRIDKGVPPTVTLGILKPINGAVPVTNDGFTQLTNDSGCHFYKEGAYAVYKDVDSMPTQDIYGDRLNTGYAKPVTSNGANLA